MSDKLNMQIGERWQLVRNWFGEENEMYRELLEENPTMYVAAYVESEPSGEFEKGQRLLEDCLPGLLREGELHPAGKRLE
jgi:hypothetical protein